MNKYFTKGFLMEMPSGQLIHPSRLICRDGSLMWKHALSEPPRSVQHEQNIIKTAQRLEELNTWVSSNVEPWDTLSIHIWYAPDTVSFSDGCCVHFGHNLHTSEFLYDELKNHLQEGESLTQVDNDITFRILPG